MEAFRELIQRHGPGSKMRLRVRRGDGELDLVAEMLDVKDRHGPVSSQERSRLWGPLSKVRLGFDEVIQHDTVLRPEQCGGPLVNLDGEVVGINIARVGRIETLAITAKVARDAIAGIMQKRDR
jgi:serine protease Do